MGVFAVINSVFRVGVIGEAARGCELAAVLGKTLSRKRKNGKI